MRLLPYPSLRNAVPALTLVAVNITNMGGPTLQLAAVLGVLALCLPLLKADFQLSWVLLLGWVGVCLVFAVSKYGVHHSVIKAGKLCLFCLVSGLSVRGSNEDKTFPALLALRAFFCLCALNFLYGATLGDKVFRGDYFIEFSIYSSYTIAILYYLARPRLTIGDRLLAFLFSMLCGSTTGLLTLVLAEVVGRNLRPRFLLAGIVGTPIAFIALNFLMEARGKSLTLDYLMTSDRARLMTTFYDTTLQTFSLHDWIVGKGVGRPFHEFITTDEGFDGYLHRLGEDGIYSFCLHNEAARILCDFGLVGLLLIGFRLWVTCPRPVLILLAICMVTNSYLYSFSGALVASSLFNSIPNRKRRPIDEADSETSERALSYA